MPNRLAQATSPYLQQHADNPVAWLEWGEEAFAKAREEQKPIFLSIGYSTCHWCHVMAHECFEHAGIAEQLNTHFVPIKVDREERPDVDRVYMTYVQALTGHGGWPLSVWLTPDLKPFFGGTYFPPEDRPGRPGLPTVLQAIANGWANERDKLVSESQRVTQTLQDYHRREATPAPGEEDLVTQAGDAFDRCYQYLYESFDQQDGGFGGAPKFPRASNLEFLFRCAVLQRDDAEVARDAVEMATRTLRRMAEGGIHDHVGGGFHRYAVDEAWFVPHFEKMLYDQAQIAVNLIDAHAFTGDERYAWVARQTLDYVLRDLTHPAGGFFAAEDADSELPESANATNGNARRAEGAFYLWRKDELDRVLGPEAAWFNDHFGVTASGNVPPELDPHGEMRGGNILRQTRPLIETARNHQQDPSALAEKLANALERLRAVRALRPRPHRDEKVVTGWNGLMLSAFARAARSTASCFYEKKEFYRAAAERAAAFLQEQIYDPATGELRRSWREGRLGPAGYAEDYAGLIAGLLDLYESTWNVRWLRWSVELQSAMDRVFWDEVEGGYHQSSLADPAIVLRLKDDHDGAEPSANSLAAANLLRLATILHDQTLAERGLRTLRALQPVWQRTPWALPALLCAVERALEPATQVVLAGDPTTGTFEALAREVQGQPGPHRAVLARTGAAEEEWLINRVPALGAMTAAPGEAAAYVCREYVCQAPVKTRVELRKLLS